MPDVYNGTLTGLKAALTVATTGGAKTELIGEVDKILAAFPSGATSLSNSNRTKGPFDEINPGTLRQLRIELNAFRAAIVAGA